MKARAAAPDVPTHTQGRILDWFLISLGATGQVALVHDTGVVGHTPVFVHLAVVP